MRHRSIFAFCVLTLVLAAGCDASSHGLSWGIEFENPALRKRATLVEAQVRVGGCDGATVFSTRISAANAGQQPADFPSGRYGFYARARDASCRWFASGCLERELPSDSELTVVLREVPSMERDLACVEGDENQGAATASDGGSTVSEDGGAGGPAPGDDAGSQPSDPDAPDATPGVPDAGYDAGPLLPSTDCAGITPDVVACYDFDARLTDASRHRNDAQGNGATFERLGDDRALRVQGSVVSVADDESLDLRRMTLELWLRIDSLRNVQQQAGEMTIVVDKDQQYLAGFTAEGAPTFSVYDFQAKQVSITAEDFALKAGQVVYLGFTYDGTTAVIYVDGVRVDARALNVTVGQGPGTMHIGSGSPEATRAFDGLIDALRISDRAHSDAEMCARAGRLLNDGTCQ